MLLKRIGLIGVFMLFIIPFMEAQELEKLGIWGLQAPSWEVDTWIDENGESMEAIDLKDFEGKVVYLYGFQSWCPGCHKYGFPTLKKLATEFKDNDNVAFVAVQTVFEGHGTNTKNKLRKVQQQYDLKIPFGHDTGDKTTRNRSKILTNYRTGGTPWVVIIDTEGTVMYNDFHIETEKASKMLKALVMMGGTKNTEK